MSAQSVELYGRMDLGYQSSKVTTTSDVKKTSLAGAQNSRTGSRLGFKGTEDLGGGLKASFVYELGINPDYTAHPTVTVDNDSKFKQDGAVTTRLANLAVSGGFGTVAIGTYNNMFDNMTGASVSNLLGASAATGGGIVKTSGRSTNGISYTSPSFSGLTVGFGTGKETTDTAGVKTGGSNTQLAAAYQANALTVLFANSSAKTFAAAGDKKESETAIKASYNVGVAVPYIVYAKGNTATAAVKSNEHKGYEIGATFPMGAITPYISLAANKSTVLATNAVTKYKGNAVGVSYALSKRTSVYGQMANGKTKVDGVQNNKASLTQIGLIHTF